MTKNNDIREAVEAELGFDPLVEVTDITVRNMNGDVALNGTVPSYPQYLEAAAATQRIDGVKNVHNHLEVVLPPGDYRDDAQLTTAANNALTLNVTVPDGIEATARDGNLTLPATVKYRTQRSPSARRAGGGEAAGAGGRGPAPPGGDSPAARKGRRHPALRWIGHGVLFVALAAGVFGFLPRIGGLTRDAAGLRHASLPFVVGAVLAQAVSLACYALLYRRGLASLGARVGFRLSARVTLASFPVRHLTPFGSRH